MSASGVQQSNSVIHKCVYSFSILFPFRFIQNITEFSVLYSGSLVDYLCLLILNETKFLFSMEEILDKDKQTWKPAPFFL